MTKAAICAACWELRFRTEGKGRTPRVEGADLARCAFCGQESDDGLSVEHEGEIGLHAFRVASRMREIEGSVSELTGEDAPAVQLVIAALIGIDPGDSTLSRFLTREGERVLALSKSHYMRDEGKYSAEARTLQALVMVGLLQGVTMAAAAESLRHEREQT